MTTIITIPTYNREKMIEHAIDSVISQTVGGWKLMVFDDGSEDNTKELVSSYRDDRISFFRREKNRGLVYTFNEMLERVIEEEGHWSWLASDDRLMPDFLEEHGKVSADATWSDFMTLRPNGAMHKVSMRMDPELIEETMKRRLCVSLASMRVSIDTLRKVKAKYGTFCDGRFKHMNDWDFMVKLSSVTKDFKYIDRPLAVYSIHEGMGSAGVYFGEAKSEIAKQFMKERAMGVRW